MDISKIYQMFIIGTGNHRPLLQKGLGGIIFFSKDITSETRFKSLIEEIKADAIIPPFLAIDQEGGRVERTENIYPKRLSMKYAYEKGEDFLKSQTDIMAKELYQFGINLNFAPCCDVNTNPENPIIGERAFSNKANEVINGAKIVSDIYFKNNIIPCIKHYPGHGDASSDSHKTLPMIDKNIDEMESIHIKPFCELIRYGIDIMMVAHLFCTCFDKEEIPTTFSKNAINYARNKLNFNGVLISDDMVMKGVPYPVEEACIKGIEAGLNMFIYREANDKSELAIESVIKRAEKDIDFRLKIEESYDKIIKLKHKYKIL